MLWQPSKKGKRTKTHRQRRAWKQITALFLIKIVFLTDVFGRDVLELRALADDRNQNICKCNARVGKNDRGNSKTYHLT